MDRAIYGDNQFFGISHYSEERAKERARRFSDPRAIYDTLCMAHEIGIRSFMFTTHEKLENVFSMMRKDPRFSDFKFIPCIPYAHKYADAMVSDGVVGAMRRYLPRNVVTLGWRAARSVITRDPGPILKSLLDAEMRPLRGLHVEAIFLQNIAVDFALGLGMHHLFQVFSRYTRKAFGARPGFVTMNFPMLEDVLLDRCADERPLICCSINKIGFRMNPSQSEVERAAARKRSDVIAMSVLASGAIPATESFDYIKGLSGVQSVLFGASSAGNIKQSMELVNQAIPEAGRADPEPG